MTRAKAASKAASNAAPPAPKPFENFKLALCGKFNSIGYTQSALEAIVKDLGGSVGSRVDANTTHLVSTVYDFDNKTSKVAAALAKDIPIVKPDWLLDCGEEKKAFDLDDYLLSSQPKNGTSSATDTKAKGSAAPRGTKRKADDANGSSQKTSQKKTASDDKKSSKAEDDEEVEEEKEVAEGQFVKRKDVVIPLDEHCPEQDRTVYIDPDTGMIYDASLNQSNSSHNNNKFYRIQVCCYLRYNSTIHADFWMTS